LLYFTCNHIWNYFSNTEPVGKYSRAAISLWNNFEKNFRQNYFRGASTKAEIIYFTCYHGITENNALTNKQTMQQCIMIPFNICFRKLNSWKALKYRKHAVQIHLIGLIGLQRNHVNIHAYWQQNVLILYVFHSTCKSQKGLIHSRSKYRNRYWSTAKLYLLTNNKDKQYNVRVI